MSEDMLNVMGSFISTELDAFENLHKELEEKDKEIEMLKTKWDKLKKWANEPKVYICNYHILDKMNEIDQGSDKE